MSRVWLPPSASITQTSWKVSDAFDVYAICVPSGDQDGQVSCAGVAVIRVWLPPSASITQMSQFDSLPCPQRA